MFSFIRNHWLWISLLSGAGVLLFIDPLRNALGAGLAFVASILSFTERILGNGAATIGQPKPDPARQVDTDIEILRRGAEDGASTAGNGADAMADASRVTEKAIRIVAGRKGQDTP